MVMVFPSNRVTSLCNFLIRPVLLYDLIVRSLVGLSRIFLCSLPSCLHRKFIYHGIGEEGHGWFTYPPPVTHPLSILSCNFSGLRFTSSSLS